MSRRGTALGALRGTETALLFALDLLIPLRTDPRIAQGTDRITEGYILTRDALRDLAVREAGGSPN